MTPARRLMLATSITLMTALALFAIVANTGAFRSSDAANEPPVELSAEGTAFVSDSTGITDLLALQDQVNAGFDETTYFDDDEWDEYEEHEDGDDHEDHEEHDEHDDHDDHDEEHDDDD